MKANQTSAVLPDANHQLYPLEAMIRMIGRLPGSFVIGIFDCCREAVTSKTKFRGSSDNEEEEKEPDGKDNFILIFGCAPNKKVPQYSFISRAFFKKLRESTYENGCVMLPNRKMIFTTWQPNGEGEITIKVKAPLHLYGPDPDEDENVRGA